MSRRVAMIDLGIALALAVFVLIISPGIAVAGLIAGLVLVVCGVSFAIDAWRRPRQARTPRRTTTRRR